MDIGTTNSTFRLSQEARTDCTLPRLHSRTEDADSRLRPPDRSLGLCGRVSLANLGDTQTLDSQYRGGRRLRACDGPQQSALRSLKRSEYVGALGLRENHDGLNLMRSWRAIEE
jgi:hypothetical protein